MAIDASDELKIPPILAPIVMQCDRNAVNMMKINPKDTAYWVQIFFKNGALSGIHCNAPAHTPEVAFIELLQPGMTPFEVDALLDKQGVEHDCLNQGSVDFLRGIPNIVDVTQPKLLVLEWGNRAFSQCWTAETIGNAVSPEALSSLEKYSLSKGMTRTVLQ